jgi:hypothetical protein
MASSAVTPAAASDEAATRSTMPAQSRAIEALKKRVATVTGAVSCASSPLAGELVTASASADSSDPASVWVETPVFP